VGGGLAEIDDWLGVIGSYLSVGQAYYYSCADYMALGDG